MGRPQTVADEEVLAATARAIGRLGPTRLTLAEVAKEAGLVPATLVQRFGSKRGLLLAVSQRGIGGGSEVLRAARAVHDSPLAALRAGLVELAGSVDQPEAFANHLAFLQYELSDPDFRPGVRAHFEAVLATIRVLLDEAVSVGELRHCDTAQLARSVQVTYNGVLITWAAYRRGSLEDWLGRELEAVLAPYRRA